jgi:hypothetical protein
VRARLIALLALATAAPAHAAPAHAAPAHAAPAHGTAGTPGPEATPEAAEAAPDAAPEAAPDAAAEATAGEARPADAFPATLGPGQVHDVAVYLATDHGAGFLTVTRAGRRWTSAIHPMWWAAPADLDGDGVDEIVLGIWSRARRHDEPEPHRAIWVVAWDGRALVARWRGSALARPLADALVADLDRDGRAELLALERAATGCVLAAYAWNGFGFTGRARRSISCAATLDRRARQVQQDGRIHRPALRRGRLVLP